MQTTKTTDTSKNKPMFTLEEVLEIVNVSKGNFPRYTKAVRMERYRISERFRAIARSKVSNEN